MKAVLAALENIVLLLLLFFFYRNSFELLLRIEAGGGGNALFVSSSIDTKTIYDTLAAFPLHICAKVQSKFKTCQKTQFGLHKFFPRH